MKLNAPFYFTSRFLLIILQKGYESTTIISMRYFQTTPQCRRLGAWVQGCDCNTTVLRSIPTWGNEKFK